MTRAILMVLDSVGIGGAPDAARYGDDGADTLGHVAEACRNGLGDREGLRSGPLRLPNLSRLGIGCAMAGVTGQVPRGWSQQTGSTPHTATPSRRVSGRTRQADIGRSRACPSPSSGACFRAPLPAFRRI
jgi:phosphopentomutase